MSVGIMEKLAEFCVAHSWNYEITAAIVETAIFVIPLSLFMGLILWIIHKDTGEW